MQFKKLDIYIFSILSIICEFLSSFFFKRLDSGFYLSFSLLLFLISSLRWGIKGIIPFIVSGIPLIFLDNIGYLNGTLYYVIANAFAVVPIVIFELFIKKNRSRNVIIKSPYSLLLYSLLCMISLSVGKALVLLIINHDFTAIGGYLVSNIFTFVLSYIVLYILSKVKNSIVTDMDVYINDEKGV